MPDYEQIAQGEHAQKAMAKLDDASKKFGGLWKMLFFLCACCVTGAGVISIVEGAVTMDAPFDFINYVYLTLFGIIMMVIDIPFSNPRIDNLRFFIFNYALFMTRFVGRGFWYLFLSAMTVGALWDNGIEPFLGFILGAFIATVAIASIIFGVKLSRKLESLRLRVAEQGPERWGAYVPIQGVTKLQFRDLSASLRGVTFSDEELKYIVAALSFEVRADDVITRDEFDEWARGPGMTIL